MSDSLPQVTFTIDGKEITVPKGMTVYEAAKKMGIEIPIFCYLDRMPPFGACRMCLVEVEKMPKLQTSCTLEATEGMVVKTQTSWAVEGRKEIIEFLLLNHPLDCPICDRGGECPLQENTLKYGPGMSRFFEAKRRFPKPKPLGPVLMLDRERCIVCARCTRFGDVLAGDHALEFLDRGYKTEVGTPDGGPVESKFIGNTIMICPVGALTSQVYRFRARPWDNDSTKSTCTLCPVGCSMILDARDGEIMRTRSYENKEVNDIWLCDKGWFGYEFTYHSERLTQPLMRHKGELTPTSWEAAFSLIAERIKTGKEKGKLAAFGGNPLTFEENYLFQKLMREGGGVQHLDHRIGSSTFTREEEGIEPGMEMTIGECEELTYAILLGLDLTEEFPVIWLRLRQAINKGAQVIFIGHYAPEIAPYLSDVILHPPGQEINKLKEYQSKIEELSKRGKGAIFVGRQYLNGSNRKSILGEILKLQQPQLSLNIMEGRGNSMGARLAGMRPDVGPLGESIKEPGLNSLQVIETAARSGWDFLYVAGANPATAYPSKLWAEARKKLGFMVVQDVFFTETAAEADLVLPTYTYIEKEGSFINIEGRVQKLLRGKEIPKSHYSDAEIFIHVGKKLGIDMEPHAKFSRSLELDRFLPKRPDKITGPFSDLRKESSALFATFAHTLFDHGVRMRHDSHLINVSKEPYIRIHPQEGQKRGLKDGEVACLSANGNTIQGKIRFDGQIALETVVLPLGFKQEFPVNELGPNLLNGMAVEIKA